MKDYDVALIQTDKTSHFAVLNLDDCRKTKCGALDFLFKPFGGSVDNCCSLFLVMKRPTGWWNISKGNCKRKSYLEKNCFWDPTKRLVTNNPR